MNAIDARELLAKPLVFGNREQIEAGKFLADIEKLRAMAADQDWILCPCCEGARQTPECGECLDGDLCEACEGGWIQACGLCDEVGLLDQDRDSLALDDNFSDDVVIALILEMAAASRYEHLIVMAEAENRVGQC